MAQFSISYRKTQVNEGGWVNDPDDKGGETWHGIARNKAPGSSFEGWAIIDARKKESDFPKNLESDPELIGMAVKFYHDNFWALIGGDSIPDQSVADHMYDVAVNSSPETSVKFLQASLNLLNRNQQLYPDINVDGKVGPSTIGTLTTCLSSRGLDMLLKDMVIEQGCNFRRIMLNDPTQEKFLTSWYSRLHITVQP